MSKNSGYGEQNTAMAFDGTASHILTVPDMKIKSNSNSVIGFPRSEKKKTGMSDVSVGIPRVGWLLFLGDIIIITLANFLGAWIRLGFFLHTIEVYTVASAITIAIYPVAFYIFDLYNAKRSFRSWEAAYRSAFAVALGGFAAILAFYVLPYGPFGRGLMAIQMGLIWLLLNGWRWFFGGFFQTAMPRIPTLILGAGFCGRTIYDLLKSPLSPYDVKGFLDDDPNKIGKNFSPTVYGSCEQLTEIADQIGVHTAILAIPKNRSSELVRNVLNARLKGIQIQDMADVYEQLTGRIPVRNIGDQWLLFTEGFYLLHKDYIQKIKRLFDFAVSGLILALTAPIMGLAALAIRIDSPGPIFYSQKRVGKGQEIFPIYKFRSMRADAEAGGIQWASDRDPRITRVGRILRLTHIDEIPQIWNIFKGDMSLVGPRPERPEFVEILEKEIPYYFVRHSVKPGMTGWAQINYQYGASIEDTKNKLEYDLYYVKNMSPLLDLKVILRTIGVVLLRDGAR